ncbi:MAG: DNA-directed RNA polymerase subunit beta [Gammaproteobacteria bacterium]|nr:DNA-directed RNA polymerase subunit beta [Gammaproteobacteria bacterium]
MYSLVKYGKKHVRRNFRQAKHILELPNLIENQLDSFKEFTEVGLKELFEDISPVTHLYGPNQEKRIELYFNGYHFDEPKYSILECKERETSYTKSLRCEVQLHISETGEVKENKNVFMADFPWMTPTGTFIINGAERVVVNQIIRSSGVLFKEEVDSKLGKSTIIGQVIPTRGAWIEFETGSKDILYAKVDRSKKIYLPEFLKSIGIETHDMMKELFGATELLVKTLEKDPSKDYEEAMKNLYMKVKGDDIPVEGVKNYLQSHLMDHRRYDLMEVGRYKFNKKLDFVERALGNYLAKDYVITAKHDETHDQEEMVLAKGTYVDKDIAKILRDNRTDFRRVLKLDKELRNEMDLEPTMVEEIQVYTAANPLNIVKIVGSYFEEERQYITTSDMIAATSYWLNLFDHVGHYDDVDNLANRRLRLTGELLSNQIRVGLAKLEKSILEKMTTKDPNDMTAQNLINIKPLQSAIKDFFGSSQLSQFMAQTNPLDEITHKRRMSALGPGGITRDRAGIEVRDVHPTHYGRICPIETPEGQNIGLITSLATYAKVNKYGFIMTPYYKVVNGIVTDEHIYMTADEEAEHYIAEANTELNDDCSFKHDRIYARHDQETALYPKEMIDYMDVSPKQIMSVSASCIPFLEHDDANRTLMGSNMQRQSIPLLKPQAPFVGTGIEYRAAHDSGVACICEDDGIVEYVDGLEVKVRQDKDGELKVYKLNKFIRSNQGTCVNQTPIVEIGEKVAKGDILADGPSMDQGELALGRNVLIGFMTWEGYNYEDAVVMNENLVKNDVYTSIHIERYEIQARDTKLGKEEITREIPNASDAIKRQLDADGIVIPGSLVKEGDILVGKITPKGVSDPTGEERLLLAIFGAKSRDVRDTSLKVPHGGEGIVQAVRHFTRENDKELISGVNEVVRVYIVQKRKIRVGDKMSGRHGNKGVISNILPQEDMPFLADGTPLDILLNPQGVPSRMNIGQVLEVHLGMACRKLGVLAATEVFDCCRDEDLEAMMAEAGMSPDGKVEVYDGRTGDKFDNRITVGVMYMIKLDHMVDDKLHARSVGPYVLVTQQPIGGKAQNGGQRFGEMEVWALEAYGAAYTLQEMLTIKSDDILGRNKVYRAITEGKEIPEPNLPESFRVLTRELRSLGIFVELKDAKTGENVVDKSLVDEETDNFIKKNHV